MGKKDVSFKTITSKDQALAYIGDLVKSIKGGLVTLEMGDQAISLEVADEMTFELEAGTKKGRNKLSLELSWRIVQEVKPEAGGLSISSKPVPKEAAPEPVKAVKKEEKEPEKKKTAPKAAPKPPPKEPQKEEAKAKAEPPKAKPAAAPKAKPAAAPKAKPAAAPKAKPAGTGPTAKK